jgi:Uma2 family endonuclease
MSTLAHALVLWSEFLTLPERPDTGQRYELHDGEVTIVPPPRPIHIKLQKRIELLLEELAGEHGVVTTEFPYRPVPNLQYWFADVAYIPKADWDALPPNDYPVYAPPLIVEVLSPSNTAAKIDRQRIVAISGGTQEFWVVDPEEHSVEISGLNGSANYARGDVLPVSMLGGSLRVERIFEV